MNRTNIIPEQAQNNVIRWMDFITLISRLVHGKYSELNRRIKMITDEKQLRQHHGEWRVIDYVEKQKQLARDNHYAFLFNLKSGVKAIKAGNPRLGAHIEGISLSDEQEIAYLQRLKRELSGLDSGHALESLERELDRSIAEATDFGDKEFAQKLRYYKALISGNEIGYVGRLAERIKALQQALIRHSGDMNPRSIVPRAQEVKLSVTAYLTYNKKIISFPHNKHKKEDLAFASELAVANVNINPLEEEQTAFLPGAIISLNNYFASVQRWIQGLPDDVPISDLRFIDNYAQMVSGISARLRARYKDKDTADAIDSNNSLVHLRSYVREANEFRKWLAMVRKGLQQSDWGAFNKFYDNISAEARMLEEEYGDPQMSKSLLEEREKSHQYPKAWEQFLEKIVLGLHGRKRIWDAMAKAHSTLMEILSGREKRLISSAVGKLERIADMLAHRSSQLDERKGAAVEDLKEDVSARIEELQKDLERLDKSIMRRIAARKIALNYEKMRRTNQLNSREEEVRSMIANFSLALEEHIDSLEGERLGRQHVTVLSEKYEASQARKTQGLTLAAMKRWDAAQDAQEEVSKEVQLNLTRTFPRLIGRLSDASIIIARMVAMLKYMSRFNNEFLDYRFEADFLTEKEGDMLNRLKTQT